MVLLVPVLAAATGNNLKNPLVVMESLTANVAPRGGEWCLLEDLLAEYRHKAELMSFKDLQEYGGALLAQLAAVTNSALPKGCTLGQAFAPIPGATTNIMVCPHLKLMKITGGGLVPVRIRSASFRSRAT